MHRFRFVGALVALGLGSLATLPVRLYLWTVAGVAVLFALSWYLDVSVVPFLWRNQP